MALARKELKERVQEIAQPLANALVLQIVDVTTKGRGAGAVIRVTVDKDGGVGINDCEQFHRSLSHALDVADPIPHAYRLEVSSPGLDRPLKGVADFTRCVGKRIRCQLREPIKGNWVVMGRLTSVDDQGVIVAISQRKRIEEIPIGWDLILQAKREVEF